MSLLTATIDEDIERIFLRLPDDERVAADRRPRPGRARAARRAVTGRRRRPGDPHPRRLPPRPDPVRARSGWVILDFEGEPARPLPERRPEALAAARRRRHAALVRLRDERRGRCSAAMPAPEGFEERARERFLEHYLAEVDPTLLPAGEAAIANLLSVFELEKAIYELQYELDNRPDWVAIPGGGDPAAAGGRVNDRRGHRASSTRSSAASTRTRTPCSAPTPTATASSSAPTARRRAPITAQLADGARGRARADPPRRRVRGRAPRARRCRCATGSRSTTATRGTFTIDDPYAFEPTLGELDLHLIGEGRHEQLYEKLGAHVREIEGVARHRVRGLGARGASGQRRRRLQLLGRAAARDALARVERRLGAVPARRRARRPLQVRDPRRRRRAAAEGRPVRPGGRAPAEDGLGRLRAAPRVDAGRRAVAGASGGRQPLVRADVDLRGPPRLVAAQPARGQPPAHLPRARRRAVGLRHATWASPTSSCCR